MHDSLIRYVLDTRLTAIFFFFHFFNIFFNLTSFGSNHSPLPNVDFYKTINLRSEVYHCYSFVQAFSIPSLAGDWANTQEYLTTYHIDNIHSKCDLPTKHLRYILLIIIINKKMHISIIFHIQSMNTKMLFLTRVFLCSSFTKVLCYNVCDLIYVMLAYLGL